MNRLAFALPLALLGILALVWLLLPRPTNQGVGPTTAQDCASCHPDVYEEWKSSFHSQAYIDPDVRKLSNDFENEECLACHAPRPVFDFPLGDRVLARQANRADGVDCLSCHALPDGGVAGTKSHLIDPPCAPVSTPALRQVEYCGACHNQHRTVDQWREAPASMRGQGCLDCHMPVVWREGGRKGRSHACLGGHDLATVQRALTVETALTEDGVTITLTNSGAAHAFPTDERSRAVDLQVRSHTLEGGWSAWTDLHRIRDPYRYEIDLERTLIDAGESRSVSYPPPEAADRVEFRLLYKTNPYLPDEQAMEVGRWEVPC